MTKRQRWIPVLSLMGLIAINGCSATMQYVKHSDNTYPGKDANCKIQFMSTAPDRSKYEEIGEVIVQALQSKYGTHGMSAVDFTENARKQACAAGGDVVVKELNGLGQYVRGIILRRNDN